MKRLLLLTGILLITLALLGAGAVTAENIENETGTINGTALIDGETPVEDLNITLHQDPGGEDKTYNTTTNADGEFWFENLNTTYTYQLSGEYQGITYHSDTIEFDENVTELTQNITVYEKTNSTDDLIITGQGHLIFIEKDEDGGLNVLELIQFLNNGNQTIDTTLQLDIPEQAEIEMTVPETIVQTDEGMEAPTTLEPGESDMYYIEYHLDVDIDEYQFEKEILYETEVIGILADSEKIGFGETQNLLRLEEPTEMNDIKYNTLIAGSPEEYGELSVGDTIMVDLQEETDLGIWIYLAVFGLILTGMIAFWKRDVILSKLGDEETSKSKQKKGLLEQEKEEVFSEMDKLDDEHRRGEVSDEEYRERMKELKKQAVDIMKKIEQKEGGGE
ncbi:carboxypeptidase-like regulatory domain-containing protein [Methanonatronarchaeum sp. AMET6-2]|uniref:carboxypeptidase-like regulatory domain-containing protein n=1 Tax=Methanonatronarchaeum sp. AMET6-2 TaxID=2933293 RepID=UPI0012210EC7|nr:carboxypeptidase-like regulatory domain-containing protein [Methanonatronarchaeum sp. AMET6-2]RZN63468.1 MAG: carboxypeptidase regulatory-like domain-containing protein [Methanonatronarchaeia archaeon]UOY09750.1 carboxypeptidase-like regulatory domain-containing protein [Methanonatronarchaeum sp. AMET6-2]